MAASMKHSGELIETHRDTKILKKLAKLARKLSSKELIKFSNSPSLILCVQNGGLGNDVSQEQLLSLFLPFGDVENIVMLPQKSFCFVHFTKESTSVAVFDNLNGHILKKGKDPSQDVVLYCLFVEKAPEYATTLFDNPNGLHILEDFIDKELESQLLSLMNEQGLSNSESSLKHRYVKHYGYEFKYDTNDVDIHDPLPGGLPPLCLPIIQKAVDLSLISHRPDQLTINRYQPGQGIPSHVDTVDAFENGIMSLSLGSQTVMEFRHPNGCHARVVLPPRSLMVMTGESRYVWSHGITPRKSDIVPATIGKGLTLQPRGIRTSYTFRKVIFDRTRPQPQGWTIPQTESQARELEKEHVHKVYEDIADHFSGTRYKAWPRVVEFLTNQPSYSLMADIGCGNGKCLGINKTMFEIGCDYSTNLLSICQSRGYQTCVADVCGLPFRTGAFDVVLCIAVIHHMATKTRRLKALTELVRVLQSGGKALVYVWAMEQQLNKTESKYIKSNRQKQMDAVGFSHLMEGSTCDDWERVKDGSENSSRPDRMEETAKSCGLLDINNDVNHIRCVQSATGSNGKDSDSAGKTLKVHINRTEFQEQDLLVPWQLKGKEKSQASEDSSLLFHRFYHVFKQGELEDLCQSLDGCVIHQSYYDQGNWCVVLEKL